MKVITETSHEMTPVQLAATLAKSEPSEFAAFWFAFAKECKPEQLDAFAIAMASVSGSARKQPLNDLCRLMQYHETRLQRENEASKAWPDIQLETEVRLPCGCVLKHKIKQHSGLVPQPDSLVRAAGHLAYWVETRAKQHECALVSEDNPAGKRPFQTGVNKLFNEAFIKDIPSENVTKCRVDSPEYKDEQIAKNKEYSALAERIIATKRYWNDNSEQHNVFSHLKEQSRKVLGATQRALNEISEEAERLTGESAEREKWFKDVQEAIDKAMCDYLFPNIPLPVGEKAVVDDSTKPKTILESLLDMKDTAINQGIKPPFTVRISNNRWEELKAELGAGAVIEYRMKKGVVAYQIHGMNIEVERSNTPPYLYGEKQDG